MAKPISYIVDWSSDSKYALLRLLSVSWTGGYMQEINISANQEAIPILILIPISILPCTMSCLYIYTTVPV